MALLGLSHSHSASRPHAHSHGHGAHHHHHGPAKSLISKSAPQPGQAFLTLLGLPRTLFSLCFGFGATGLLLEGVLHGWPLLLSAGIGAVVFQRFAVAPIFSFLLRFASSTALTLEDLVLAEAKAVTAFNARGEGLVLVHLDGRALQILARLEKRDVEYGARVRAGDRLSIVAVDPKRNSCTVTPIRS